MATQAGAETPVLTVYAGDYFTSEWGPGPVIETEFEKICACDLQFSTGDLVPRLLLEGERTKADVVIGLSSDVTAKARSTELFAPHGQDNSALTLPISWTDEIFLPFNYGHTAFIYNAFLNQDTICAHAGLSGIAKFANHKSSHCLIEVGIIKHNKGCITTEFHRGLLNRCGALR